MPLLAIDQGNSRTKFGLFVDGDLVHSWVTATDKQALPLQLAEAAFHLPEVPRPLLIGLCTVVPELVPAWEGMAEQTGCTLIRISGDTPTPLRNAYETPQTLGPDRLMAAVAAAQIAGAPVIPISLGTASVVDAVDGEGCFLGGMIAPGIGTSAEALSGAASALWPVQWHEPAHPIGRTSEDAMTNGLFYQSIGGLQAMIAAIRAALGAPAPLVLTGGWAQRVAPHLDGVAQVDENLVLRGIAVTLG